MLCSVPQHAISPLRQVLHDVQKVLHRHGSVAVPIPVSRYFERSLPDVVRVRASDIRPNARHDCAVLHGKCNFRHLYGASHARYV